MALNSRLDPWIGDQRRRIIKARAEPQQPIIDKPIRHDPIGESEEEKLARQKRREAIGQRYLAGRGAPFIMSAQLKGPFDKSSGWRNPWLIEEPEEEAAPKENIRPLPLQKLAGRPRNGSVASVRSVISIGSNSQSMAGDRLNTLRQPAVAAKPNLHGGLKQFLGATAGSAPSSNHKPDRDNIPHLPPLKRKADTSWLKGADIVKKKRKELPDLPSPTPPSRVGQEQKPFVTPTNLLNKFRQHSHSQFSQGTSSTQRPVVGSNQGAGFADIPSQSQGQGWPPLKKQRQFGQAPESQDDPFVEENTRSETNRIQHNGRANTSLLKTKLSQIISRRSTSDASALTATHEEPIRPLAARVRSLNEREVVGSGSFPFRRTKRLPEFVEEPIVSSIERDEDEEETTIDDAAVEQENETEPKIVKVMKQALKKPEPVSAPVPVPVAKPIPKAPEEEEGQHHQKSVDERAEEIRDKKGRIRNSQSLPSDSESETESPEKTRVPPTKEAKEYRIRHAHTSTKAKKQYVPPLAQDETGEILVPSTAEEPSRIAESQSQSAEHHLTTIQEVTEKTTGATLDSTLPTVEASTNAIEDLAMDVLEEHMLDEGEADTSMPDIPDSTPVPEHTTPEDKPVEATDSQDVMENTYVQMATGSLSTSTGSNPNPTINHTQSTAMNTQAIETLKANLLEESDEDEEIMAPDPRTSSSAKTAIQQETPMEEDTESDLSQSIFRSAARPQISSSEPTNTASSRPGTATSLSNSQGGLASQAQSWVQLGVVASMEPSGQSQYRQGPQEERLEISDSAPTVSGATTTDSQPIIARIIRDRFRIPSSEPTAITGGESSVQQSIAADATESSAEFKHELRQQGRPQMSSTEHTQTDTAASDFQAATTSAEQSSIQQSHVAGSTDSSNGSQYAQREGRPQISSPEATLPGTSGLISELATTSAEQNSISQNMAADTAESSEESQLPLRQQILPRISDSEPTNTGTTTSGSQVATNSVLQTSTQPAPASEPTVDDILRILRSSPRRDDSQGERTSTQASQNGAALDGDTTMAHERTLSQMLRSTQEDQQPIFSPSHSQVYSHAGSQHKSSQVDAQVQLDFHSSQPQSYVHVQDAQEEDSSIPTNTGTTTTESLLLQAIAQDMARPDEGRISHTGLTESTNGSNEKNSGQSESTPKASLSQRTMASSTEEVQVEKSSHELPAHSDGPILAPEVLQEPETQSWHISTIEEEALMDLDSNATQAPHQPSDRMVMDSKPTSSPQPSIIPASVEEAPPVAQPQPSLSLSDNPWAIATQQSPNKGHPKSSPKKRVAFSDPPTSSSVDDDDLDRPAPVAIQPSSPQQSTANLPSSPPVRMVSVPPAQQQIPVFSPPPVYHEPPSTESPFPIIINGVRNRAPQMLASSQGVGGMANAFLNADKLAPIRELEREDTLSPPKMLPPARQHTPEPMEGVEEAKSKLGQSSVARQLAAMYPSSSEDEDDSDVESPSRARQIRSCSRQLSQQFHSQEPFQHQRSSPPVLRGGAGARVQVSRSPSTITDPYANPWATQQPPAPPQHVQGEEEDYDDLPPFAMGNILGMLGDEFGSSRAQGGMEEEGVGQVADEMSDLLGTWDVDEELSKQRRKNGKGGDGDKRSSARERVGWGRF